MRDKFIWERNCSCLGWFSIEVNLKRNEGNSDTEKPSIPTHILGAPTIWLDVTQFPQELILMTWRILWSIGSLVSAHGGEESANWPQIDSSALGRPTVQAVTQPCLGWGPTPHPYPTLWPLGWDGAPTQAPLPDAPSSAFIKSDWPLSFRPSSLVAAFVTVKTTFFNCKITFWRYQTLVKSPIYFLQTFPFTCSASASRAISGTHHIRSLPGALAYGQCCCLCPEEPFLHTALYQHFPTLQCQLQSPLPTAEPLLCSFPS